MTGGAKKTMWASPPSPAAPAKSWAHWGGLGSAGEAQRAVAGEEKGKPST